MNKSNDDPISRNGQIICNLLCFQDMNPDGRRSLLSKDQIEKVMKIEELDQEQKTQQK